MNGTAQRFLFVGERPSKRAAAIGATWENGKLAGKQLRDTLLALGIAPQEQAYLNLWTTPTKCQQDSDDEARALMAIWRHQAQGYVIVGMGKTVCRRLFTQGVPHLALIHPAARGFIRKKERYQAHAYAVLQRDREG